MPTKYIVEVSEKLTNDHPMYFETIDMTYQFEGNKGFDMIKKVVKMSEDKYCGLTYMLGEMAKINIRITLNEETIQR